MFLIAAALAGVALAIIILKLLNWSRIISWFKDWLAGRHQIKNKAEVAFTLHKKLASGDHKVIQGIFNKNSNKVADGVEYKTEELDEQLATAHRKDDLVIYE